MALGDRVAMGRPQEAVPGGVLGILASQRLLRRVRLGATYGLLVVGAFFVVIPFFWMISSSLKEPLDVLKFPPEWIPDPVVWRNYYDALTQDIAPFAVFFRNSALITATALIGQVVSASVVAYSFARLRWWGRDVLFLVVLATMMLPHQVTMIPVFVLFKSLHWLDTFKPLIVPAYFGGGAFYVFLMRQFMMTISLEIDDAAKVDGCNTLGLYRHIILPLSKPALGAAAIFSFQGHWNDFLGPLIYLNSMHKYTVQLGLAQLRGYGSGAFGTPKLNLMMAAATLVMLPCLLLFFFAQRQFIQGVVITGVKG